MDTRLMATLVPVLLAGGSGTRLWPTSRTTYPKQFIDLVGSGESFFQSSLKRSLMLPDACPWIIVTGEEHRFLVAQQAQETGVSIGSILLEPSARNTAPAIALAAFEALELHTKPKLLVQTSDHYIQNLETFVTTVMQAFQSSTPFVLFGVKPTYPETGYGYLECEKSVGDELVVVSFTEKPDSSTAKSFCKSNNYLWNSGMFMLDAEHYLKTLNAFEPTIYASCDKAYRNSVRDLDFKRIDRDAFEESPSRSVDHAIMERTENLIAIPYPGDWSDVGSWDAVAALADRDENGNAIQGDGVLAESSNTLIRADSRLVTGIGLKNLIIIETSDAVLVADATKTQNVKNIVETLKSKDREEVAQHHRVHRPWGFYETLVLGDRFKVKQIVVNPGESLSLQEHRHRSEHWIVVSGTAEVQVNDTIQTLTENESTYIPIGSRHRLSNRSKYPLAIIEVQSGSYLGEDDIVRFDDKYGRLPLTDLQRSD